VIGTSVLLDAAREHGVGRYLQVSTDEVYGSIEKGTFTEHSPLNPSSPYSATKAAGDLLVSAHVHTYGIEAVICRGSNNYGPRQYPEKLIPLCVLNAMAGDSLPVYGDGRQVRNWLYVEDFARAIDLALRKGVPGEVYNVGGPDETANIDVVRRIIALTDRDESLIEYVTDRPGHDRRYSLSSAKIRELGWEPSRRFQEGLQQTVEWYRDNEWWWGPIRSGEYRAGSPSPQRSVAVFAWPAFVQARVEPCSPSDCGSMPLPLSSCVRLSSWRRPSGASSLKSS
jgi:dTDP-glucose 4,6-dehydratase